MERYIRKRSQIKPYCTDSMITFFFASSTTQPGDTNRVKNKQDFGSSYLRKKFIYI